MIMENFEDLFDDNLDGTPPSEPIVEPGPEGDDDLDSLLNLEPVNEPTPTEGSVWDDYLAMHGFVDGKLKIIDENEEESEINFYDLTKEEQLQILSQSSSPENDYDLDDSEIELLNSIRESNKSVKDFLEDYKNEILAQASAVVEDSYTIDDFTDDEIFELNLRNQFEFSDDEIKKLLEREHEDEEIFKKKVEVLRKEYKELEDQYKQAQEQEVQAQQQEQYLEFTEKMTGIANTNTEFYGIELEDEEKNEVLSFLLEQDDSGTTAFYRTLNNPEKLYEAAWFLRYGKESFDALVNAYESEIQKLKKADKPNVVHRQTPKTADGSFRSIHDLF